MWSEVCSVAPSDVTVYSGALWHTSASLQQAEKYNHWRSVKTIFSVSVKLLFNLISRYKIFKKNGDIATQYHFLL